MSEHTPEDEVASRIADYLAQKLGDQLGFGIRGITWHDEQPVEEDAFPWLVTDGEGRKFELEFDVTVTELTPERLAKRAAADQRLREYLDRSDEERR